MRQPSIDALMSKFDSKYALVAAAAKRARRITDGAPVLIEGDTDLANKPVSAALMEIGEGHIIIEAPNSGIK